MGSADWMQRNLDRRVELVFPIENEDLRQRAFAILNLMLSDNRNMRIMQPDTVYTHIDKRGKAPCNCQTEFSRSAQESVKKLSEQDSNKPFKPIRNADMIK